MNQKLALTCNFITSYTNRNYFKSFNFVRSLSLKSKNEISSKSNKDKIESKEDNIRNRIFIINEEPADLLINKLKEDLKSNDTIIEVEPGIGILTKKILNEIDNKLLVFEPTQSLVNDVKTTLPNKFSNLSVTDIKFHSFYSRFCQLLNHNFNIRHDEYIKILQSHCSESSNLKIIGTVHHFRFFYSLILDYAYRGTLFNGYLNPTFYLFVPFNIYASILKHLPYRTSARLGTVAQIYFDINLLGITSDDGFQNPAKMRKKHQFKICSNQYKNVYLLRLSPKDLTTVAEKTGNQILSFNYFVNHLLRMKCNSNLINEVEKFVPNCGEEFIKNGFRVFDHPDSLSEEEWFKAFEIFTSHPDFKSSIYMNEMIGSNTLNEESIFQEEKNGYQFGDDIDGELNDDDEVNDIDDELQLICEEMLPEIYGEMSLDS